MLPLEKSSGLERVRAKLVDATLDLRRRGLPEREFLVELRAALLDQGENLMIEELEMSLLQTKSSYLNVLTSAPEARDDRDAPGNPSRQP